MFGMKGDGMSIWFIKAFIFVLCQILCLIKRVRRKQKYIIRIWCTLILLQPVDTHELFHLSTTSRLAATAAFFTLDQRTNICPQSTLACRT